MCRLDLDLDLLVDLDLDISLTDLDLPAGHVDLPVDLVLRTLTWQHRSLVFRLEPPTVHVLATCTVQLAY